MSREANHAEPVAGRSTVEMVAVVVLLGLSVLVQAGFLNFAWAEARVSLSFMTGILLPGYLILAFVRLGFDPDALERLCLSFAAGFSLQAIWCLVMMNAGGNTRLTAWLQTLLTLVLFAAAARSGRLGAFGRALRADLGGASGFEGRMRMLLLALLMAFAYELAPVVPYAENEEMVIGRKLFENTTLSYRNVMHVPDEPTTYLYPVHMFVQAVLAHLASLDVLLVHIKLRTLLAVLGILVQYSLIKGLSGRAAPAIAYALVLLGMAAWDPNSWSYSIGIVVPFNNRFGVAPWILAPLALYLILLLYRGVRSAGLTVLWVAFLFASALVHAKEALQVLMIAGGLVVISSLLGGRERRDHRAVALAIVFAAVVLGLYSRHHHHRVASMEALTGSIKQVAHEELDRLDPLSPRAWIGPVVTRRYDTAAGAYDVGSFRFIVPTLLQHTAGFYFRLALPLLPLLPFLWRRWPAIFLLSALYVPLLFLRTPMLYLSGAAVVGTSDLELMIPILALGSFLVVVMVSTGIVALALRVAEAGTRDAPAPVRAMATGTMAVAVAGAGFWLARDVSGRVAEWVAADAQGSILRVLAATTAAVLVAAVMRRRADASAPRELGATLDRWPFFALPALVVLLAPTTMDRQAPSLFELSREFSWQRGLIDLDKDFDRISKIGNIQTDLDPGVIEFVRVRVGPHHVFATTPSYLNRLVLYTNSYIANAPSRIATAADVAYFKTITKLGSDPIFNDRDLATIVDAVRDYLQLFGVEYILVPPNFDNRTNLQLALLDPDQTVFREIYRSRGWTIWRVERSRLAALGVRAGGGAR